MIEQVRSPRLRLNPCSAANGYLAVSVDGNLYPCHKFVGKDEYILGNIDSGIERMDIINQFISANVLTKSKCQKCWAAYLCGGGCFANAYIMNKNIMEPHEIDCELMRFRIKLAAYISSRLDKENFEKIQKIYQESKDGQPY
jgi:uncharacterized protein